MGGRECYRGPEPGQAHATLTALGREPQLHENLPTAHSSFGERCRIVGQPLAIRLTLQDCPVRKLDKRCAMEGHELLQGCERRRKRSIFRSRRAMRWLLDGQPFVQGRRILT